MRCPSPPASRWSCPVQARSPKGGDFTGGGVGLVGGAGGIAIAALLNKLSTTTSILNVLTVADDSHEGFFLNEDLRRLPEPPRRVRRLQALGRLESCREIQRSGTAGVAGAGGVDGRRDPR